LAAKLFVLIVEAAASVVLRVSVSPGVDGGLSDYDTLMDRRITGYHQDEEGYWVAELACGHQQHVRHNPPWVNRPWVATAEGRTAALGAALDCKKCDFSEVE